MEVEEGGVTFHGLGNEETMKDSDILLEIEELRDVIGKLEKEVRSSKE